MYFVYTIIQRHNCTYLNAFLFLVTFYGIETMEIENIRKFAEELEQITLPGIENELISAERLVVENENDHKEEIQSVVSQREAIKLEVERNAERNLMELETKMKTNHKYLVKYIADLIKLKKKLASDVKIYKSAISTKTKKKGAHSMLDLNKKIKKTKGGKLVSELPQIRIYTVDKTEDVNTLCSLLCGVVTVKTAHPKFKLHLIGSNQPDNVEESSCETAEIEPLELSGVPLRMTNRESCTNIGDASYSCTTVAASTEIPNQIVLEEPVEEESCNITEKVGVTVTPEVRPSEPEKKKLTVEAEESVKKPNTNIRIGEFSLGGPKPRTICAIDKQTVWVLKQGRPAYVHMFNYKGEVLHRLESPVSVCDIYLHRDNRVLYFCSDENNSVCKFGSDSGSYTTTLFKIDKAPRCLAITSDFQFVVAMMLEVRMFSGSGGQLYVFKGCGVPHSLTVDNRTKRIVLTRGSLMMFDYQLKKLEFEYEEYGILKIDASGLANHSTEQLQNKIGAKNSSQKKIYTYCAEFCEDGNFLLVADENNNRVLVMDSGSGETVRVIEDEKLSEPYSISATEDDVLWVGMDSETSVMCLDMRI